MIHGLPNAGGGKEDLMRVDAAFENRGDSDWFRVHLLAGQSYQVRVSAANPSIRLTVMLPDGQEMHFPIPYANYASFVAPVDGDYFISATSLGVTGGYTVTVEAVVDPIPATVATPASLAVGETQTISGNNGATINDDWFAIGLVAGESYGLATDNITGKVYITDGDGAVVAIEGADRAGGQQVHFTATATGRFYAGAQHGGTTTYKLSLLAVADDHGDTPADAGAP